jgi:hypothetical protein
VAIVLVQDGGFSGQRRNLGFSDFLALPPDEISLLHGASAARVWVGAFRHQAQSTVATDVVQLWAV